MSDDRFLDDHRRMPRAGFVRALREQLREQESEAAASPGWRWYPAWAGALGAAGLVVALSIPAVRATAQDVLDLFRVRTFTPVAFDPERVQQLRAIGERSGSEGSMMFLRSAEMIERPGEPRSYESPEAAAAQEGVEVFEPEVLPRSLAFESARVTDAGTARLTLDTRGMEDLLEVLGIDDVQVPAGLDGKTLTVHTPKAVTMTYRSERFRAELVQVRSPQVMLPEGVELQALGEIALRVLGLDAREARRMARTIDWHSSLIVPLPTTATSFREVTISGARGLLVSRREDDRRRESQFLLWSREGRVYSLTGNLPEGELVQMAESVR